MCLKESADVEIEEIVVDDVKGNVTLGCGSLKVVFSKVGFLVLNLSSALYLETLVKIGLS